MEFVNDGFNAEEEMVTEIHTKVNLWVFVCVSVWIGFLVLLCCAFVLGLYIEIFYVAPYCSCKFVFIVYLLF